MSLRLLPGVALALLALGALAESNSVPASPARPPAVVVGVSPFLEPEQRQEVFQQLVRLLVTRMPLDSTLSIVDAHHLRLVAQVEIPDRQAFSSEKTRLNQFAEPIRRLKQFLARNHEPPTAPNLDFIAAVRTPQVLEFVAQHLVSPGRDTHVILVGSPLYQDAQEPAFSMAQGFFPSDGHLLATPERSLYGTAGREQRLQGVSVDWGYFGEPWSSELHRERLQRFWRLYVQQQGGHPGLFSADLPTLFRRAVEPGRPIASLPRESLDDSARKIEMVRLTRSTDSTDWITSDQVRNVAVGPPTRLVGPLKIGIRWSGDLDLDLYARPATGRDRLSFEHVRSEDGYYFKDHRTSPERDFEFIEFTEPVDVRELKAAVNLYEGRSNGPVTGEVRIEFEGRVHLGRFELAARAGNQGREGRGQGDYWFTMNIPALMGLSPGSPASLP